MSQTYLSEFLLDPTSWLLPRFGLKAHSQANLSTCQHGNHISERWCETAWSYLSQGKKFDQYTCLVVSEKTDNEKKKKEKKKTYKMYRYWQSTSFVKTLRKTNEDQIIGNFSLLTENKGENQEQSNFMGNITYEIVQQIVYVMIKTIQEKDTNSVRVRCLADPHTVLYFTLEKG